jgi:NADH-ubiquinone oxidoreductase chain 6
MLNLKIVELQETGKQYTQNLPFAIILGLLFGYEIFSTISLDLYNVLDLFVYFNNFNFIPSFNEISNITSFANTINTINNFQPLLNLFESTHIESIGNGLYSYSII